MWQSLLLIWQSDLISVATCWCYWQSGVVGSHKVNSFESPHEITGIIDIKYKTTCYSIGTGAGFGNGDKQMRKILQQKMFSRYRFYENCTTNGFWVQYVQVCKTSPFTVFKLYSYVQYDLCLIIKSLCKLINFFVQFNKLWRAVTWINYVNSNF